MTYVFSAFYHSKDLISIISTTTRKSLLDRNVQYQCRFFNEFSLNALSNCNETIVKRKAMPENRGKRYSAAFYTCPLPKSTRPYAVSLSTDHCKSPSNILPIIYPQQQKRKFTVCVSPLNYRYSKAYELVEMIELNRILGAEYFVFYNYSTDSNVDRVLEYYKEQGLVEVLKWNLPMKVDTWPKKKEPVEIHYFAQLAALNDCLYRNMYLSKYVVFQDLDEFIIPKKHLTWSDMMEALPKGSGAYIFRCFFFRKEWPDTTRDFEGKDKAQKYKMNTLLKQKRESKLLGKSHRSKYIIDPKQIDTVGIHNIWRYRSGSKAHFVDSEFARMHHYRDWLNPNDANTGIEDNRTMVYKNELLQNTVHAWEKLIDVPLGPIIHP
ncbi:beta-1,4-galactosyltransferase galt-1-like isoform X2 [Mytilus californianus]|uniref:beta-1,4-galactosyltransferase galt-1-like isoform X2 n=1 Tax=Mytilus californianus TaxID=6549 RepID=UPI0022472990|nr:beta-1,4-galactosyltransferase galt-1-like isoform X2 [Mytilus californianus]